MTRESLLQLIKFLEATPERIQQIAGHLADDQLRWKPSVRDFSVLEHVCHLNDIEREGYSIRIGKFLNEELPFLADVDGDKLAEERDYNSQDFNQSLGAFSQARKESLDMVRGLNDEQLNRSGMFQDVGVITLGKLLLMMTEHDQEHRRALSGLQNLMCNRSE